MYVCMHVCMYVCMYNFMYVFWIPWHRLEGSCEIGSVHPSSVLLSRRFLGMVSLVFSKFWHVLESHIMLCLTESDFPKKKFAPKKFFLLNLCCNENFSQMSYLGKFLVSEIWTKMFSANQIAGFFKQSYLQIKWMKWPDFLHADTNSHKLKVYQKVFWCLWSGLAVSNLIMGL